MNYIFPFEVTCTWFALSCLQCLRWTTAASWPSRLSAATWACPTWFPTRPASSGSEEWWSRFTSNSGEDSFFHFQCKKEIHSKNLGSKVIEILSEEQWKHWLFRINRRFYFLDFWNEFEKARLSRIVLVKTLMFISS